jgi:hypothetical protein
MLSFLRSVEDPGKSVREFANLFVSGDAQSIVRIIYPEVMADADISPSDVANFVGRFRGGPLHLESFSIDSRFKDEDGATERFQATLMFTGPQLAPEYPGNSSLRMTLLWILNNGRWWLERPVAVERMVVSNDQYPTAVQDEAAMRFEAAMGVLEMLRPMGSDKLIEVSTSSSIAASRDYKEMERLYPSERGVDGVSPRASGVHLLLRAAGRNDSRLLELYRGDFPTGPKDKRPSVPWDMFQGYVLAAIKKGHLLEADEDLDSAESLYRNVMAFGNQIAREPGGFQFVHWGTTFEKQGADELGRMLPVKRRAEKEKARALSGLLARRLDTIHTAADCLDKMEDFQSLKAAIAAGRRKDDQVFRPLAVNTLCIFALKGASANSKAITLAGGMVVVKNPLMGKIASEALEAIGGEPGTQWKSFVEFQKEWVRGHNVYGTCSAFR